MIKKKVVFFDKCADEGIFDTFSSDDLVKLQAPLGIWEIQPGQSIRQRPNSVWKLI